MMNLVHKYGVTTSLLSVLLLLPFAGVKVDLFRIPFYLPEIAILLAVAFFFLQKSGQRLFSLPGQTMVWGCALFLGGALLSFFTNPFSLTGLGMLKSWFFFPVVFGWLLWSEMRVFWHRERVLFVWLLLLTAVAVRSLIFVMGANLTYDGRLSGDYTSPNFLAIIMAPAPLLALYFFLAKSETKRSGHFLKILFLSASFALTLSVIFFTHSYGVWSGLVVATVLFFLGYGQWYFTWKHWAVTLLIFLGGLFGVFIVEHGSDKWQAVVTGNARSSLISREMIWQAALKISLDHPLFGIGVGRFQTMYLEYQHFYPPYLEWAVPEPHNLFLAVFLATGLAGLWGFFMMVGSTVSFLIRQYFSRGGEKEKRFTLFLLSLWVIFLVYGLTDTPYFKNDLAIIFFTLVALSVSRSSQKEQTFSEEKGLKLRMYL